MHVFAMENERHWDCILPVIMRGYQYHCPNLGIKWVILENSIQSILCDAAMRIQPFCPDTVMKGTISISSHLHVQCQRAYDVFVCLCRSNVKASSLVCSSPVGRALNNFGDNLSQQMHGVMAGQAWKVRHFRLPQDSAGRSTHGLQESSKLIQTLFAFTLHSHSVLGFLDLFFFFI